MYAKIKYPEALPLIEAAYAEAQKASSYEIGLAILKKWRRIVARLAEEAHKPRQHLCYVYASLSRLDFRGLLEKAIVVFEGLTGFLAEKKPTALMMHWWNGGRGGV